MGTGSRTTRLPRPRRARRRPRAIVIGGSLAGLLAGTQLRAIGWDVDIFDRSPRALQAWGGAVPLHPDTRLALRCAGAGPEELPGLPVREHLTLDPGGRSASQPMRRAFASWAAVHQTLRRSIPDRRYHAGGDLLGFEQDGEGVSAYFDDHRAERGDLLIGADGHASTVRRQLLPGLQPTPTGWFAVRGIASTDGLPPDLTGLLADRVVCSETTGSRFQACATLDAGSAAPAPGRRQVDWVWHVDRHRNPIGRSSPLDAIGNGHATIVRRRGAGVDLLRRAEAQIGPQLVPLLADTRVLSLARAVELSVPRMAFGRVALLGDAAFTLGAPSTASIAQAAVNAITLAEALEASGSDVERGLARWEPGQLDLGNDLIRQFRIQPAAPVGTSTGPDRPAAPVDRAQVDAVRPAAMRRAAGRRPCHS